MGRKKLDPIYMLDRVNEENLEYLLGMERDLICKSIYSDDETRAAFILKDNRIVNIVVGYSYNKIIWFRITGLRKYVVYVSVYCPYDGAGIEINTRRNANGWQEISCSNDLSGGRDDDIVF